MADKVFTCHNNCRCDIQGDTAVYLEFSIVLWCNVDIELEWIIDWDPSLPLPIRFDMGNHFCVWSKKIAS